MPKRTLRTALLITALGICVGNPMWAARGNNPTSGKGATGTSPAFKLAIRASGVYRVSYQQLAEADPRLTPQPSDSVGLLNAGQEVPLWMVDGEDGEFGPGDHLEFLGQRLLGNDTYHHDHSQHNAYFLRFDQEQAARLRAPSGSTKMQSGPIRQDSLSTLLHLEEDRLMLRFNSESEEDAPESWYWAKLTHAAKKPFRHVLKLGDRMARSRRPVSLRIDLRGWSMQRRRGKDLPSDHRVEVMLNGTQIAEAEWNGQEGQLVEVPALPPSLLRDGNNDLEIKVPARKLPAQDGKPGDTLVDVVLLNWIEVSYPRRAMLSGGQRPIWFEPDQGRVRLYTPAGKSLVAIGSNGTRLASDHIPSQDSGEIRVHTLAFPPGEDSLYMVVGDAYRQPLDIVADRDVQLRATEQQADYLMITHPRLRRALEPLAEVHRRRGLTVKVVDVYEIYDEFSHGIIEPHAIRDFIGHAYHQWQKPAPRFVLLAGDASWDTKNKRADNRRYADWTFRRDEGAHFIKNASNDYEEVSDLPHRNLVPAGAHHSSQGHAASDNYFVAVDGDDILPDLAIGRFPVTEVAEVEAIVDKTIRYLEKPNVGPWRRSALFITNESDAAKRRSDRLAASLEPQGLVSQKIYPAMEEDNNDGHKESLRLALDDGKLLVHFFGHGGRYIWRTGPPDYRKNHDLFTLDDLEQLVPNGRLSVVLSMTCYSAPFDHPTSDSIGEKFLRLEDRGAVGVVAASWRNMPSAGFSEALLEGVTGGAPSVGEALLQAKREVKRDALVAMYNLLGDPAVPVALPALPLRLQREAEADTQGNPLQLTATVEGRSFRGRALVEWLDEQGEVLASDEMKVRQSFDLQWEELAESQPASVRVYVWNARRRIDGVAHMNLLPEPDVAQAETATPVASGVR